MACAECDLTPLRLALTPNLPVMTTADHASLLALMAWYLTALRAPDKPSMLWCVSAGRCQLESKQPQHTLLHLMHHLVCTTQSTRTAE